MNAKLSFLMVFYALLTIACQETPKVKAVEKKVVAEKTLNPAGIKVWLYDFNPESKAFQFRQENTGFTAGDPIRIAIRYFLDNNHLNGSFKQLALERIGMQNKKAAFIFSGRIQSEEEEKDLAVFKMALDSTIMKNSFTKEYSVIINGKKL